jgi:hypothetical protein
VRRMPERQRGCTVMNTSKTIIKDGFTVTKMTYMGNTQYEYRGVLIWRSLHRKGNPLSMGNGWKFNYGTVELVGGKVVDNTRFESTLVEAFKEIDRLMDMDNK